MNIVKVVLLAAIIGCSSINASITPYKYSNQERERGLSTYTVPADCRFTVPRKNEANTDIVYYMSCPTNQTFPIAFLLGGSSLEDDIISIIHFHRYFLQEFLDLGVAVITVEQEGVDGHKVDKALFMKHYTRSNRLSDHRTIIDSLFENPPKGWNGKLIFLGVSEGGPLVLTLSCDYADKTVATINWSGCGDLSWRDDLWIFMQHIKQSVPWFIKLRARLPLWMPYSLGHLYFPESKKEYDKIMDATIKNPTPNVKFAGMTYKYHADCLVTYPKIVYQDIKSPLLIVVGAKDCIINSCDSFVHKAQQAGVPVTYFRIDDMDHYIKNKENVIQDSFNWLEKQLADTIIKQQKD